MIIFFQILWAVGCIAWNLYGLWLIQQGQRPIGPTASLAAAFLCLLFGILFWVFRAKAWKKSYIVVSLVACIMAMYAALGGITGDPALWPSEFWRISGIVLNGMGGLACLAGIVDGSIKLSRQAQVIHR